MNIHLIHFIQDNCKKFPNIINPDLMGNLVVADGMDRQHRTKAGKPGMLNPLPPTWVYQTMNCIQLINLWLLGAPAENVTPLKNLTSKHVLHFDDTGANLSRMWRFMEAIEHYGKLRNV
jgi:hypothetical protein